MTTLQITTAELHDVGDEKSQRGLPDTTTLTEQLPPVEIARAIGAVLARADRVARDYALELVTAQQVRVRIADDSGERLSLAELAVAHGFDLEQLPL